MDGWVGGWLADSLDGFPTGGMRSYGSGGWSRSILMRDTSGTVRYCWGLIRSVRETTGTKAGCGIVVRGRGRAGAE